MKNYLLIEGKKYISSREASRLTGYSSDYIGQLCRSGRVESRFVGRSWYVEEESLQKYKNLGLFEASKFRPSANREPHFARFFVSALLTIFAFGSVAYALSFPFPKILETAHTIENSLAEDFGPTFAYFQKIKVGADMVYGDASSETASILDSLDKTVLSAQSTVRSFLRNFLGINIKEPSSTEIVQNATSTTVINNIVRKNTDTSNIDEKISVLRGELDTFKNFQSRQTDAIYNNIGTSISNISTGISDLNSFTTSNLTEGSNLYFTGDRVVSTLAGATSTTFGGAVTATTYYGDASNLTGLPATFSTSTTRSVLSSSATGLDYSTSTGDFSLASGYVIPLIASTTEWADRTGDWTGTFDGQEGTYYLDRANHTGTQTASTISDFSSVARGLLSSSAAGLDYSTSTGDFSLTSGYSIPLTASTTEWANKVSSQWITSGSNIYYNTGNVGIATTTNITSLLTIDGGIRTANAPMTSTYQEWNNSGVTFQAKVNNVVAGNTSQANGSALEEWQVNGTSAFRLERNIFSSTPANVLRIANGGLSLGSGGTNMTASTIGIGAWNNASTHFAVAVSSTHVASFTTTGLRLPNTGSFGWTNSTTNASGALDTSLFRNAAGVVEINNGTSGTWRDLIVRNLSMGTTSTSTTLTIQGEAGKNIFSIASSTGTNLLTVTQAGNVGIGTSTPSSLLTVGSGTNTTAVNGINFGDATANLYRSATGAITSDGNLYAGGLLSLGNVRVSGSGILYFSLRSRIASPSDGIFTFSNDASNNFNRLQFGGTTSSFPALVAASSTSSFGNALQVIAADGTSNSNFLVTGSVGIGTTSPSARLAVTGPDSSSGKALVIANSANAERFTFLDNGNFGILNTNPQRNLSVNGSMSIISGSSLFLNGDSDANWYFGKDSSHNININGASSGSRAFQIRDSVSSDAVRFSVNFATGNVGIGTSSPTNKLEVGGNAYIGGNITATGTINVPGGSITSGSGFFKFIVAGQSDGLQAVTQGLKLGNGLHIRFGDSNDTYITRPSAGNLQISSDGSTGSANLLVTGNIGIGTTTPGSKLAVSGTAGSSQDIFSIASSSNTNYLVVTSVGTVNFPGSQVNISAGGSGFRFGSGNLYGFSSANIDLTTNAGYKINSDIGLARDAAGVFKITNGSTGAGALKADYYIATSTTASSTFTAAVGIGSSTPAYKLSVNGSVGFAGLNLSTTGNYLCIDTTTNEITSGTLCTLSSSRFKQNVKPLDLGLDTVLALNPVTFNFKQGYGDNGATEQLGFVAEQANLIDPRLVPHDEKGLPSGFNYQNYTAVLTKAIQEQQQQINDLKNATTSIVTNIVQEVSATTTAAVIEQSSSFISNIATAVKNLLQSASEWIVSTIKGTLAIFDRVETKQLCVGQTCVTEDQLKTLLANANVQSTQITTPIINTPPVITTPTTPTSTPAIATSTPETASTTMTTTPSSDPATSTPVVSSPESTTTTPPATEPAQTTTEPAPEPQPEPTPAPAPDPAPAPTPSVDNAQ